MTENSNVKKLTPFQARHDSNICVGQVIAISKSDQLIVDFYGNENGGIVAKCLDGLITQYDCRNSLPISVLLVFEENNALLPIVVGKISDSLPKLKHIDEVGAITQSISIDGSEDVLVEANKELVLRCGKSSITLKRNGKIMVKGVEIVSRSSGNNKLKGATININ